MQVQPERETSHPLKSVVEINARSFTSSSFILMHCLLLEHRNWT